MTSRKSLVEELQSRLDSVNKKVMEQKEEHVEIEEQLRRELSSQVRMGVVILLAVLGSNGCGYPTR